MSHTQMILEVDRRAWKQCCRTEKVSQIYHFGRGREHYQRFNSRTPPRLWKLALLQHSKLL